MKILDKFNINFNKYTVGKLISNSGADGEVFESNNNIIKFVMMFDSKKKIITDYNKNKNIINKIIESRPNHFVEVYDFGFVKEIEDYNKNYCLIYFYLMEKLNKISDDEKRVFHSLISHEDFNKIKKIDVYRINSIIKELDGYLSFDKDKVLNFIKNIKNSKIEQTDIHERNIMKDNFGNFKFIDLERLNIK